MKCSETATSVKCYGHATSCVKIPYIYNRLFICTTAGVCITVWELIRLIWLWVTAWIAQVHNEACYVCWPVKTECVCFLGGLGVVLAEFPQGFVGVGLIASVILSQQACFKAVGWFLSNHPCLWQVLVWNGPQRSLETSEYQGTYRKCQRTAKHRRLVLWEPQLNKHLWPIWKSPSVSFPLLVCIVTILVGMIRI